MIRALNIFVLLLFFASSSFAQKGTAESIQATNPKFTKTIERWISHSVPVISVDQLAGKTSDYIVLDCREREEYDVSHLPDAQFLGYKHFEKSQMESIPKDAQIVVYCSIGYRSEKIGEKLNKLGYSNVQNLYGSIFEWVNQGNEVVDKSGERTNKVHGFNKSWSKWIDGDQAEKVW